jgi:sugar phosphate isomerase/epimerase
VTLVLGNSGAPRWYDCDRQQFPAYLDLLEQCGATAAEIVLHDGDADEFTSRVHVLREDWEFVTRGYRDRDMRLYVHGPLTQEFSPLQWQADRAGTLACYVPILRQVAEIAADQDGTTLVLHGVADPSVDLEANERGTTAFLTAIVEEIGRWSDRVAVAIELRAFRPERFTAAATTRDSVLRIVQDADHPQIGICWDVAHDVESRIALGAGWQAPEQEFLQEVIHLHLHDLGHDDEPHCPPLIGRVPLHDALRVVPDVARIMEVRWRMAERMGKPWDVLAESYQAIRSNAGHPSRRS